jgi:hypothetical protein
MTHRFFEGAGPFLVLKLKHRKVGKEMWIFTLLAIMIALQIGRAGPVGRTIFPLDPITFSFNHLGPRAPGCLNRAPGRLHLQSGNLISPL